MLHEVFRPLDAALRDAALIYSGFPSIKDHERKPTKTHHSGLILGMNETHADKIKKTYKGTGFSPTIDVLGVYSGIEINTEDNLGSTDIEKYKTMCKQMMIAVPIAIDRFLDEKAV